MFTKHIQQEKGYTLFLTLLVAILFGVLAITSIMLTMNGVMRNRVREQDVQARELAEKGLEHITQEINTQLESMVNSSHDGVSVTEFNHNVNQLLKKYECENSEWPAVEGETGTYRTCIHDESYKMKDDTYKAIRFKSTGIVADKEKTIYATIYLGGRRGPDFMKYAVNTFKSEVCQKNPLHCASGEGNLFLHGGVSISGDMNVEGNLITTNRSYEKYLGKYWIHSYFPSAKPAPDGSPSKLSLGGNIYTITFPNKKFKQKQFDYDEHINRNDFNCSPYKKRDEIDDEVFVGAHIADYIERDPERKEIDISGQKDKFIYNHDDPGVRHVNTSVFKTDGISGELKNTYNKYANHKVFPHLNKKFDRKRFYLLGHHTFSQFATYNNLHIGRTHLTKADVTFKKGLYVGGDLIIENKATVKGPIFVNGDLIITGDHVSFDALIYVNGNVKIRHAKIKPLEKENGKAGTLIIFSNKKIFIERNNRFQDEPAPINGYFYSKEDMEIFGNEMNIKIKGGISAPKIVLNAIRGRSKLVIFKDAQFIEGRGYEGYKEQAKRESRLQIEYDPNIVEVYSDLLQEDRVYEIERPLLINRQW